MLKQIAYAGHDNEKFMAPDKAYNGIPQCCQYERRKTETVTASITPSNTTDKTVYTCPMHPEVQMDKAGNCPKCGMTLIKKIVAEEKTIAQNTNTVTPEKKTENANPLAEVFAAYFGLKDALAKDDGVAAAAKSKELFKAIDNAKMDAMQTAQHNVWMKYMEKLSYDAEHIKGVTELEHQREHFISLSKNMFEVMKAFKTDAPVYYDFCPMANDGKGATWLSIQEKISNPYLGKQMPTCGKVQETIK